MKVLHLIGGGDVGGAKSHVLSLIKELSKYIDIKLISFRPGAFADDAGSMGIDIEVVKTGNPVSDLKKVIRIIKEGNFRIIHSHGAKANLMALLAKHFTKLPVVTTVHSDYRLDYLHSITKMFSFGLINTLALRFIDYHIGVSKNFKEMLAGRKFNPDNIFTVYNGIDFDSPVGSYSRTGFSTRYDLDLKEDDIVIGILARLTPVKGLSIFLQAAKYVLDRNPSVKFIIGGDGEERKTLERKAASLGISGSVYFLGWVDDRFEFMSSVDINVLTSLSESFPYVILEGTRFKKATVSSNVGGISDLIDSGENGYLFNAGDYKKLAEYLLKLVDSSSLRKEMGEKVYQKAYDQFSLKKMCESQLNIYKTILSRTEIIKSGSPGYDVIISGYYGFENIGDDAMLLAIINNLHIYKNDIKIMALSKNPSQTRKIYNVDSINRIDLFHIFLVMKNAKLFIYGGGNIIQDNTSTRSLIYYLGTVWLAKKMGIRVMFYANGIGPLNKNTNKILTQKIVNRVDVITLREELSRKELDILNINKPQIFITSDPALTLEAVTGREVNDLFLKEGIGLSGPYAGISVRKWGGHEKYIEVIARTADYLQDQYGLKPVFIPMQYPADLSISQNIISRMKRKGYVIKNRYGVPQTFGIIKRMEMLIGMRLHSLIFAAGMGIPIIGLVYEPKVDGFLQYIHQEQASAGHVRQLEFGRLKNLVDYTWNNRTSIRNQLKKATVQLKKKALENAKIAVELIEEEK